jgi:hypothetical protein
MIFLTILAHTKRTLKQSIFVAILGDTKITIKGNI